MSVIDHDQETNGQTTNVGKLGSVREGTGQNEVPGQLGSNVPVDPNAQAQTGEKKEKLLVMDGPLSTIYTKALDVVYAKEAELNVGQETQQMDAVMVADVYQYEQDKKDEALDNTRNGAYVYVTDDAHLQGKGLGTTFNDLRIALDMRKFDKRAVCIEHNGKISKNMGLVTDYVKGMKVPLFFSREQMLDYLKAI